MNNLQIKEVKLSKLKPYEKNAKLHPDSQIDQIIKSIKELGFNDPIACDENGVIIEGHGRYMAAKKMGLKTIPTIILRGMTEAQKKAYILAHNKLTMDTGFDIEILQEELSYLNDMDCNFDFMGFDDTLYTADIDWGNDVPELSDENYKEPEKKMLVCPCCQHIDSASRFKTVKSKEDLVQVTVDNFKIVRAKLSDIEEIKKIADKNTDTIGFVLKPALEENCQRKTLIVAKDENGKVLGFCNYHKRKDGVNVIYEICVDYKYRGNGIASAILDKMPRPLRLKCPVDNESNKFYKRYGFTKVTVETGKKRKLNVWEIEE